MNELALACNARLFDNEVVASAARDWVRGDGASFLRLKPSEVSAMLECVSQCRSMASVIDKLKQHLEGRVERQKGSSPWGRMAGGSKKTTMNSLFDTLNWCVTHAQPLPGERLGIPNPVEYRLQKRFQGKEAERFHRTRDYQIAARFLAALARIHQSRQIFKKEEDRCRKSSAS
ncbi:MAG TPA: hypothetical protein VKY85_07260 [Candidatus Angelobacter sp.]|nr:hypothetical protein [Candidatus Angelobacter sp.]